MFKMRQKKAQAIATDFFIATAIFTVILIVIASVFNDRSSDFLIKESYREMSLAAFGMSDALLMTAGDPTNWNASSVKMPGLAFAEGDREISEEKAESFCDIPGSDIRKILSLNYHFYFDINGIVQCSSISTEGFNLTDGLLEEEEEEAIALLCRTSELPPLLDLPCENVSFGDRIVSIKRNVFYGGENAVAEITLWE